MVTRHHYPRTTLSQNQCFHITRYSKTRTMHRQSSKSTNLRITHPFQRGHVENNLRHSLRRLFLPDKIRRQPPTGTTTRCSPTTTMENTCWLHVLRLAIWTRTITRNGLSRLHNRQNQRLRPIRHTSENVAFQIEEASRDAKGTTHRIGFTNLLHYQTPNSSSNHQNNNFSWHARSKVSIIMNSSQHHIMH